jgi:dCTP deaminase
MLNSDCRIRQMSHEHEMMNPFSEKQVRDGVTSYGYDLRAADEIQDLYQRELNHRRFQTF